MWEVNVLGGERGVGGDCVCEWEGIPPHFFDSLLLGPTLG